MKSTKSSAAFPKTSALLTADDLKQVCLDIQKMDHTVGKEEVVEKAGPWSSGTEFGHPLFNKSATHFQ